MSGSGTAFEPLRREPRYTKRALGNCGVRAASGETSHGTRLRRSRRHDDTTNLVFAAFDVGMSSSACGRLRVLAPFVPE
jgi:hypothetical protein